MIDVATEQIVPIGKTHEHTSGRPHLATVYRWWQKGVRGGIKLETALIGGRRFTSVEAIQRFVDRLSGDSGDAIHSRTSKQRKQAADKANADLAAAGW